MNLELIEKQVKKSENPNIWLGKERENDQTLRVCEN